MRSFHCENLSDKPRRHICMCYTTACAILSGKVGVYIRITNTWLTRQQEVQPHFVITAILTEMMHHDTLLSMTRGTVEKQIFTQDHGLLTSPHLSNLCVCQNIHSKMLQFQPFINAFIGSKCPHHTMLPLPLSVTRTNLGGKGGGMGCRLHTW